MAKVTIGEKEHVLPKLTFKRIKKIWPIVQKMEDANFLNETDPNVLIQMVDDVILILEVALDDPAMTAAVIEDTLLGNELGGLKDSITELLIESGLAERVRTGEGAKMGGGEGAETPSTETGTQSSQTSSLLDAPLQTGKP